MNGVRALRIALSLSVAMGGLVGGCGGAEVPERVVDRAADPSSAAHVDSVIVLTAEAVTSAGIASVVARLDDGIAASDERTLEVPGHVELDPRRVEVVSARSTGRLVLQLRV